MLTSTALAQTDYVVKTEDEMRNAISAVAAKGKPATISIGASFAVRASFIIPAACAGLTIRASGRFPLVPVGLVSPLFDVRAPSITIRDVYIPFTSSATNQFLTFVLDAAANTTGTGGGIELHNNDVAATRLYVQTTTQFGAPVIAFNRCTASASEPAACILIITASARVVGNYIEPDAVAVSVTGGSSGLGLFTANDFTSGTVDTTGSLGLNRFSSNAWASATLHATDIDCDAFVDTGAFDNGRLMLPPGFQAGTLTATRQIGDANGFTVAVYLGVAQEVPASYDVRWRVTTGTVGAPTWAEMAIATAVPNLGGNPSLTTRGFTSIAASITGGTLYSTNVAVTGIARGDHVWVLIGCHRGAATDPFVRAGLADDLTTGFQAQSASAVRPSTMGAGTSFTLDGATITCPWLAVKVNT
jgi:hypothetical protein